MDGCILMPEAPPFPFNPDGTQYICPPALAPVNFRPTRTNVNGFQSQNRRYDHSNSTMNSSSPPSKELSETSAIDSTMTSTEDQQQQQADDETLSSSMVDLKASQTNLVNSNDISVSNENATSAQAGQPWVKTEMQQNDDTNKQENN